MFPETARPHYDPKEKGVINILLEKDGKMAHFPALTLVFFWLSKKKPALPASAYICVHEGGHY